MFHASGHGLAKLSHMILSIDTGVSPAVYKGPSVAIHPSVCALVAPFYILLKDLIVLFYI